MIKGKFTYLRAIEKENLKQLMDWRNREDLRQYFREYREISYTMQEEWYKKILSDPNQVNFEIYSVNEKLIGCCGLLNIDWRSRKAEFSIYIGDDKNGNKEHIEDAFKTMNRYGFDELNINKIWGEVYSNNSDLDNYLDWGYEVEGVLRQQTYKNGVYYDSTIISLLKSEYLKLNWGKIKWIH